MISTLPFARFIRIFHGRIFFSTVKNPKKKNVLFKGDRPKKSMMILFA